MTKKVTFPAKPATQRPASADEWVGAGAQASTEAAAEEHDAVPLKRLTIDVPAPLHALIKSKCALRGTKMADEIRALLEQHFGDEAAS